MSSRYRVVIYPEALDNLDEAYTWIHGILPETAESWINDILTAISSLDEFPARCGMAPESRFFREDYRQLLHNRAGYRYRILFTIKGDVVHVLHVRHQSQNWLGAESHVDRLR